MRILLTCTFLLIVGFGFSQEKAWVFFEDKPVSKSDWQHPERFLSQRALERRAKQNIELDVSDFPVSGEYLGKIRALGFRIHQKSKWLNAASVYIDSDRDLRILESLSFVSEVRPMHTYIAEASFSTSRTIFSKVSNSFVYGQSFFQINQLKGSYLHDLGFAGDSMLIAVLDGGFFGVDSFEVFDSLWANDRILSTYDFVDNDTDVFHLGSHGTSVLSVMGGYLDNQLIGTAPEASYVLLKSEDQSQEVKSEEDNWVAAAEYADSVGADIINSSVGYNTFDNGVGDYTYADMDGRTTIVVQGAIYAQRKGIIVCNSMGNEGSSSWKYMMSPADADSILSVGGANQNGNYAGFASVGPTADGRIKPDVSALSTGVIVVNSNNSIVPGNGTSFSSPLIAGLTACLWQSSPGKTHWEVMEAIRKSAHQYFNPDTLLGYGIPNFASAFAMISLEEEEQVIPIQVSPNPFDASLKISVPEEWLNEEIEIRLFNAQGELVLDQSILFHTNSISLESLNHLRHGVYILHLSHQNRNYSIKLLHE